MKHLIRSAEWLKRRFGRVSHDASTHPAEAYYASIYLARILHHLGTLGAAPLRILDAGCGTGRLLVPLAQAGHEVTGLDHHRDSLRLARENLQRAGIQATLVEADLNSQLRHYGGASFDAALAIESLYVNENYEDLLSELCRIVRPAGLILVSHRTRYYYMLQAVRNRNFDDAVTVATGNDGWLRKRHHRIYYNWQSTADLQRLYKARGARLVAGYPIGAFSGFGSDPLQPICDPGQLSPQEQDRLRQLEIEHVRPEIQMACRYFLAVAEKLPATPQG